MSTDRHDPLERYPSPTLAEIAVARLEAEGIHAWVEADNVGGQYPGVEARRGARLYVDSENESAARAILDQLPADDEIVQLAADEVGEDITAAAEEAVGATASSGVPWLRLAVLAAIGAAVFFWLRA